jgi:hypothetical protein
MYNRSGIWTSRLRNTEFLSVFVINKHFSVKPHAKIFGFLVKIWKSLKKLYMPIMCNRSMIWASRSIEMKFHSAFAINLRFTLKTKVNTFIFWAKIWFFLHSYEMMYMTIMYNQSGLWASRPRNMSFSQFLPQTGVLL